MFGTARSDADRVTLESILLSVAIAVLAFQVVHFLEHVLQLGYLALHPLEAAWMTAWADWARNGLAGAFAHDHHSAPAAGAELLHLAGNGIFVTGLFAILGLRSVRGLGPSAMLRAALIVQGLHFGEHVLLSTTVFAWSEALGVSTLFGLLPGAPGTATWYRVSLHFVANLAATALGALALREVLTAQPPPSLGTPSRQDESPR